MPNDSQQSTGFVGTLKSKWGPLPVWGWLALVTVILLGYWLYEQHKNATSGTPAQTTSGNAGQPGVVVINQDEPGTEPPPPPEKKHKHGKHKDKSREITVTKDETLEDLAKQRHWSSETLRDVENMNITQGHGAWTPETELKKGQTVLRPLGG